MRGRFRRGSDDHAWVASRPTAAAATAAAAGDDTKADYQQCQQGGQHPPVHTIAKHPDVSCRACDGRTVVLITETQIALKPHIDDAQDLAEERPSSLVLLRAAAVGRW